jgi:N-acetylglucosaminyldiphosphoundecaprenol N-acetyl-beta-D-mannosaminyltransferase
VTALLAPPEAPPRLREVDLGGLALQAGRLEEVSRWLVAQVVARSAAPARVVVHVNVANCFHLLRHRRFAAELGRCGDLLFDGVGMRMGARLVGLGRLPAVNGTDLFPLVMDGLDREGARAYLVGGHPGIAELAARRIEQTWPHVRVVGVHHGYFADEEGPAVCARIAANDPDVVLVGLGFGRQERFALAHRARLEGRVLWMVGGLFDFVSGATPRAPRWMRDAGLEWLYRLAREPRRMFRRNFVSAPLFLLWCLRQRRSSAPVH